MKYLGDNLYCYNLGNYKALDIHAYELAMLRPLKVIQWPKDRLDNDDLQDGRRKMKVTLLKTFGP